MGLSRTTRRPPQITLVAAALAAVTACGSTVSTTEGAAPGDASSGGSVAQPDGLSAPLAAEGAAPGAADPLEGPAAIGAVEGAGSFGGDPAEAGTGTSAGSAGSAPGAVVGQQPSGGGATAPRPGSTAVGPGITKTTIFVAMGYSSDQNEANAAIGVNNQRRDARDYANVMIEHVNATGGVAGRKLAPIYYNFKSTDDGNAADEAACSHWTQDNKSFVFLAGGEILWSCSLKAGAVNLSGGVASGKTYTRYPNLISPLGFRLERLTAATVNGLAKLNYFKPTPEWPTGKLGLLTWDDITYVDGIKTGSLPALKRLGITPTDIRYIKTPQSLGAFSESSAAVSNAVLRFKEQGIDHVMIQDGPAGVCGGTCLSLLFLQNADTQKYYPRYGFNSLNSPGTPLLPPRPQRGMLALSWADYDPSQDVPGRPNTRRDECFKIMKAKGIEVSGAQAQVDAGGACNSFWFIQETLNKATSLTAAGVVAAAESLGGSFRSPLAYSTRLTAEQHDGIDGVRNSFFDDGCECMKFVGGVYSSSS